jgi:hypothetical protein
VQVKALACELPATHGVPLSRWSTPDIARQVCNAGLVASISGSTIWRWLHEDAIRPWYHRSWIFPRDPGFAVKANRILDLYARSWKGQPLKSDEFGISADEKTSIQARRRKHPTLPAAPKRPMRVEHEYQRCGAWAYLAALDVHHARVNEEHIIGVLKQHEAGRKVADLAREIGVSEATGMVRTSTGHSARTTRTRRRVCRAVR